MKRTKVLGLAACCAVFIFAGVARAEAVKMTTETLPTSLYDVPVGKMQAQGGTSTTLEEYKGKVLLIVNVASKCGFTPQYDALEKLYESKKSEGLVVLGFPCNDYHGQEPGSEQDIVTFCTTKYNVKFPLYAKLHTIGAEQAPLYMYLTAGSQTPFHGNVKWNFEKFVISREGKIVARFPSKVKPNAPEVLAAIEKELAKK